MQLITKENYDFKNGDVFKMIEDEVFFSPFLTALDKLIYALVKNKFNLSVQNNFANKSGEYFVYFTQKEIAEVMDCSEKSVYNSFKRLSSTKTEGFSPLIKLDRESSNTYKIFFYQLTGSYGKYARRNASGDTAQPNNAPDVKPKEEVKPITPESNQVVVSEDIPFDFYLQQAESYVQPVQENFTCEPEKFTGLQENFTSRYKEPKERTTLRTKNTKKNNNPIYLSSNKDMIDENEYRQTISMVKEQIDYDIIAERSLSKDILDDFYLCAVDMLTSKSTKVNGEHKPLAVIQSVLSRLTAFHMETIVDEFSKITEKIRNTSGYMKSMIYNACINLNADFHNTVKNDSLKLCM